MRIFLTALFCTFCILNPRPGQAAEMDALQSQIRDLARTVQDLRLTVENQQREIAILKGQTPPPFTVGATPPAVSQPPRSLQGRWNPDIGVVGDVVFLADSPKADEEGADRVSVRELEFVFGSAVDPYSRFDATLAISDFETMEVEEAYLTRFDLPLDFTAPGGRFFSRVRKKNSLPRGPPLPPSLPPLL